MREARAAIAPQGPNCRSTNVVVALSTPTRIEFETLDLRLYRARNAGMLSLPCDVATELGWGGGGGL